MHLFLSYNDTIERVSSRFGGKQHSSDIVKSEMWFFSLYSLSFNTLLQ